MSYNPQDATAGQSGYGSPPYNGPYAQPNHLGQGAYGYPPMAGYPPMGATQTGGYNYTGPYAAPGYPYTGYGTPPGYGQVPGEYPVQGYPAGSFAQGTYAYPKKQSGSQAVVKAFKSLNSLIAVDIALWVIIVLGVFNLIFVLSFDQAQKLDAALMASFMATVGAVWAWRTKDIQAYLLIFTSSIAGFLVAFSTYMQYPIPLPYPTPDGNIASIPFPFPTVCNAILLALLFQTVAAIALIASGNKKLSEPRSDTILSTEQIAPEESQKPTEAHTIAQSVNQPTGYQPNVQYGAVPTPDIALYTEGQMTESVTESPVPEVSAVPEATEESIP